MESKLQALPEDWDSALAIVAHPDDLEYGCASAVARWVSLGKKITYVMVTDGEAGIDSMTPSDVAPLRRKEELDSAAVVGVKDVEFLGLKDGVIEYDLALRRSISRMVRQYKPDVLITNNFAIKFPGGRLNMADHRAVGLAVLDAARDAGNRWIFTELLEEDLDPWNGVKNVFITGSPDAQHAVDVTAFIDKGVESLEKHRVYIENLGTDFDPDSFLTFNAAAVGERFDCDYAVAFEVWDI